MRTKTKAIALATAASLIASPALARDGAAYAGAEFGIMKANDASIDVGAVEDAVRLDYQFDLPRNTGWDGSLFAGYDFGGFRLEAEASRKKARIESVDSAIVLPGGAPAGTRAASGNTSVTSFMVNAMADFGNEDALSAFVGAGAGYAKVNLNDFRVFSNAPAFLDDGDSGFAWQLFAGLRQALSQNVDMHVKYRYFRGPGLDLDDGVNTGSMRFSSHSLLGGISFNFGAAPPPPPPPPPPAPPPPAPPAPPPPPEMRTCPDGSRVPVTQPCPVPPPPAVPPAGERG